jgi:polyphosphate kinase
MALYKLDRPELKDRPFTPSTPAPLRSDESVFDVIRRQDVLVHHPYNSFSSVVDFIRTAAVDPDTLAIKMTLYRTGQDSPIVRALIDASERGKQVAVLVELKARFDEENNIEWARQLERAGVHVVYGVLGLKTHCKLALVVRRESGGLRRYVHIGTGNYNPTTARIYTDLGLFTANEAIGADATDLFNYLTGFSRQTQYRKLLVAPVNLREKMTELIEREIEHFQSGRESRILVKINSLTDTKIIRALYGASQAGVPIDLVVRGICSLRPGVEGLSDTITVTSIVGRFLEHSRIFYFANGGAEDIYIGSADWMLRNLDRRVELMTPIEDAMLKQHLKEILEVCLGDNVKARRLTDDGSYVRVRPQAGEAIVDSQAHFLSYYSSNSFEDIRS